MDLSHQFTVPTPLEETWAHFQDIASVAECFPGAQVTSAEGDSFNGTVKVKLGPIALTYAGSGTFVEKDEVAHRFVVDAKGKDKRGNGTAGATVTLTMAESAAGGTDVSVDTDLAVTGKPAQFGRGVMQDVSDKLLGQFVACLEQRLGPSSPSAAVAAGPQAVAAPTEEAAEPAPPDPAPAPSPDDSAGAAGSRALADASPEAVAPSAHPAPAMKPAAITPPASVTPPARGDNAINLGSTVLPILFKSYWKQGLAAIVVIAVIVVLIVAL